MLPGENGGPEMNTDILPTHIDQNPSTSHWAEGGKDMERRKCHSGHFVKLSSLGREHEE